MKLMMVLTLYRKIIQVYAKKARKEMIVNALLKEPQLMKD